jgi:hypothetical protein
MTDLNPPPPARGGGDLVQPTTPPKDPILTLVLNLCAGVGYLWIGQKMKGIAAIVLWFVVGIPTCGSGAGILSILYAVDGFMQAKQLKDGFPLGPWTFFTNHR